MNFQRKIKFLDHCKENINNLDFYLDLSDKNIAYEPCLVLKKYYKWVIKHIYNAEVLEENYEEYFLNIIEKLDYKVIANMEYCDFRDLLGAYFSLGEIYYNEEKIQLAKEYFQKVTNMMEESLKGGNRYHEDAEKSSSVGIFELFMWARKNLGDMEDGIEALELYESIIGDEEFIYIEKHYSIFKIAMKLNMVATANEAIRNVVKIFSGYKGINVEGVDYLIACEEYENALDLATIEYKNNPITHWINVVNIICRKSKGLNVDCVNKVIEFLNLLMDDLKIVEWSTLCYTLYKNVRGMEGTTVTVLDYFRSCFNKVNKKDFFAFGQAILVLKNIYEDIRIEKYNKEYLRNYEFDFTLYLMNTAVQNGSYENGLESAAKLDSIIEIQNINKDIHGYIKECFKICKDKICSEEYKLEAYPWNYLYDNLEMLSKEYGIESTVSTLDIARNSSNKMIIGINTLEDEKITSMINNIFGVEVFHRHKDLVFVSASPMDIDHHISDSYSYEVIIKEGLIKENRCIMTYESSSYAKLTDLNVIIVDGHRELRDIDITYMNQILKESLRSKVLILTNRRENNFNEGIVNYNEAIIKSLLNFENIEIFDVSNLLNEREIIGIITGEEPSNIINHKFESFNRDVNGALNFIKEDIKNVKARFKERRLTVSECGREYSYIEEELNNNYKEFSAKVNKDVEFLRKYAGDKISSVIPDLLQTRFVAIDDLEDAATLKEEAEKILSRSVESWCTKNIYKLMLEQYQVYMAKYSKFYSFHEETIDRIEENRKNLIVSHPEFEKNMVPIEVRSLEEIIQEFLITYESFLQSINYKVNIIPNENLFSAVRDGIKVMFLKNEEKADNLRVKIKGLVIENKDNISQKVINNIDEKLKLLQNRLEEIIEGIFKGAKDSIEKEREMVESALKTMDDEFGEIKKKNEVVEKKMEFIEIETLKYSKEVQVGVVYSEDKCYFLR